MKHPTQEGGTPMEEQKNPGRSKSLKQYISQLNARNKRIAFLAIGACVLLLIVSLIIAAVSILNLEETDDGLILSNVYVAGVNLGGMTRDEAESALRLTIGDSLSTQDMVVSLPDDQLVLSPVDTEASVNINDLVDAAYNYGRSGTKAENRRIRNHAKDHKYVIALLDYMYLNLDYIRDSVTNFCNNYSSVMVPTTVSMKGTRPDYRTIIADGIPISSVKHQTLVITIGTPQFTLEADSLYKQILDAYSLFNLNFTYEAPIALEPDVPDANALFTQFCTLPEDARMDAVTYQVIPEVYGYGFDVQELSRLIHRADYGDTVTISLNFLYPDLTEEDLNVNYFHDVLATYISTNRTQDANRNTNLQLACKAINGMILKSGESFDFNMVLGPRTANVGYKTAPTYHGSSTNTIGGGVSQVASALRYCAMLAGLRVDEYHLHKYAVPYTPYGTDAAITYGSENLVFTNTTADPIQIQATVSNGNVTITFLGTETRNYTVSYQQEIVKMLTPDVEYQFMTKDNVYGYADGHELQSPIVGYVVELYVCHYDPVTGREISRTLVEVCNYSRRNQILVRLENDNS